jgi:CheY-like chemotaxis protein
VQWAALQAIVRMPSPPAPVLSVRVIELLDRFVASDPQPRALLIGALGKAGQLRDFLKGMGLEAMVEKDFKTGFERLQQSAEYDLVVLDSKLGAAELPYMLNQLRSDVNQGKLPIIVLAPTARPDAAMAEREEQERQVGIKAIEFRVREEKLKKLNDVMTTVKDAVERASVLEEIERVSEVDKLKRLKTFEEDFALELARRRLSRGKDIEERLNALAARYRDVTVVPELYLDMPDELRKIVDKVLADAYVARLTAEERAFFRRQSLDLLWRMARGEMAGYDIRSTRETLLAVARDPATPPELVQLALETLSRQPGSDVQQRLAGLALDPARGKDRILAAVELNRHVKKYGLLLAKEQVQEIRKTQANPAENATLRQQFSLVLGAFGVRPSISGELLFDFRPPAAPPAAPKKKAEKKVE